MEGISKFVEGTWIATARWRDDARFEINRKEKNYFFIPAFFFQMNRTDNKLE